MYTTDWLVCFRLPSGSWHPVTTIEAASAGEALAAYRRKWGHLKEVLKAYKRGAEPADVSDRWNGTCR